MISLLRKSMQVGGIFIVLCLAGAVFTACGAEKQPLDNAPEGLSGKITIIGSTSVGPLINQLADSFMEKEKGVSIDIQEIGSTQGVQAAINGTADIGTASRDLKDEEMAANLDVHVLAYDGIAVIVNPVNAVSDLSSDQIRDIFQGKIANWQDLGGANKEIVVVNREAGSGTRGAFQELFKLEEKQADGTTKSLLMDKSLTTDSTGAVKATVASNETAIGYISLGVLDNTVKALQVDEAEASVQNIIDNNYKIYRPFLMLTKSGAELKPQVKEFFDYIKSTAGQTLISENNFIPATNK